MQSKQIAIAAAAGIIILLGAGGFLLLSKNKSVQQPNNTKAAANTNTTPGNSMESSIQGIFSSGKTSKCTFDTKAETGETKGTVYVAGTNAYGNFDMISNGKTSSSYMIRSGNTFYIWGDSLPSGIKMTMSVDEMAKNMGSSKYSGGLNPNQKASYNCTGWVVDNSKFTPPSNVKFIDAGAIMNPSSAPTGSAKTNSQCSVCAYLTGDAKTSCLAQYNCN